MADPFVAEIRILGCNFAPRGWAFCNGQLMPIAQNTTLFSLLGTVYGGDGRSTFALPNLEGRAAMHPGRGPGLSPRNLGEGGGTDSVTLTDGEMASHSHTLTGSTDDRVLSLNPGGNYVGTGTAIYAPASSPTVQMAPQSLSPAGGSQPHNNMQPYLALNFCIALQGIFPPRT